jgi:hypothetical protein
MAQVALNSNPIPPNNNNKKTKLIRFMYINVEEKKVEKKSQYEI